MDDVSFTNADLAAPQDQYNRRAEKSLGDNDVPQRLTMSFSYELPFGHGKPMMQKGVAAQILGGWSISASSIMSAAACCASAFPTTRRSSTDTCARTACPACPYGLVAIRRISSR